MIFSKVKEIADNFIKVLGFGKNDVRNCKQILPFGVDSKPVTGINAVLSSTSNNDNSIVLGYEYQSDSTKEGETRFYSTDSDGNEQFYIKLTNDGICEFNGDDDNFVRFSKLEEGYNDLKSKVNNLISKYNAHVHITTATVGASTVPGTIAPTISQETPSTATISGAKIDEIKTSK